MKCIWIFQCSKQCFKCQNIFVLFSSATKIKDTRYKLNYVHNLIGSYLRTNGGQMQKWYHHWQHFAFSSFKTKRSHIAVGLYSNRSQKMSHWWHIWLCFACHILTSSEIHNWTDTQQDKICLLNISSKVWHGKIPKTTDLFT